jgi:hypothetical protein
MMQDFSREINYGIAMAKSYSTGRRRLFHQQIGLKFKEKTSELLHLEHRKLWC